MLTENRNRFFSFILISILGFFLIIGHGCGGDGGAHDSGKLSLAITDSALDNLEEVWITIKEICVHPSDGDWETFIPADIIFPVTIDLLSLQNGNLETLGLVDLPAGHYTHIRLLLGDQIEDGLLNQPPFPNCVKEFGASYSELTIPSGFQS